MLFKCVYNFECNSSFFLREVLSYFLLKRTDGGTALPQQWRSVQILWVYNRTLKIFSKYPKYQGNEINLTNVAIRNWENTSFDKLISGFRSISVSKTARCRQNYFQQCVTRLDKLTTRDF